MCYKYLTNTTYCRVLRPFHERKKLEKSLKFLAQQTPRPIEFTRDVFPFFWGLFLMEKSHEKHRRRSPRPTVAEATCSVKFIAGDIVES